MSTGAEWLPELVRGSAAALVFVPLFLAARRRWRGGEGGDVADTGLD